MLDHVTIGVVDLKRAQGFYDKALKPVGIKRLYGKDGVFSGYGIGTKAFFWIAVREVAQTGAHIAFTAASRPAVDAFYKAALAAGGVDNGAPGPRPHYHADYYGAFVLDPDGHNIEAVCHEAGGV